MPSTQPIQKDFSMDYNDMLERAQVFHDSFVVDKATFTAAFPHLADPFADDFQDDIDAADAIPSGAEVDSEISVITEQLEAQLALGRKALQKLFTYADIVWDSVAKTNTFGKNRYGKSRTSQIKMKELLETAHRKATEVTNQAALIAGGYTLADIAELATIRDAIDDLNAEQEDMKAARGEKTEQRIIAYNKVWGYMMKINQASKVVFVDSPAKLSEYLLYPTVHHELPKPTGLAAVQRPLEPLIADLSWDTDVDADYYKVYVSVVNTGAPSGTFTETGGEASSPFEAPLTSGKRNYWKIRAFNDTQSSDYSDEVWLEG